MNEAFLAAAKLRWVSSPAAMFALFGEAGGFVSPSGTYSFSRTYANGAGTATGVGTTSGSQYYGFGRLGAVAAIGAADEFAPSLELGRQALQLGGYSETVSLTDPFEAEVAASTTAMDVFKARAQWTHRFDARFDATVWGAYAHGFAISDSSIAAVSGFGALTSSTPSALNWGEYGARVGYKLNDKIALAAFVDGVAWAGLGSKMHVGGVLEVKF